MFHAMPGLQFVLHPSWTVGQVWICSKGLCKRGPTGASICCTCALGQIQMDKPALLQATSLNFMALNALELQSRDSTQGLLPLRSGHWNVEQLQGWAPPNPRLPLTWHSWKCRVGRKCENQPGVLMWLRKHYGVLLHRVILTGNKRQPLKTKIKVRVRRPLSSALKRRQQCALTQDIQPEAHLNV